MNGHVVSLLETINERLGTIARTLTASPPGAINPHQAYTRTQAARLLGVSTWTIDRARRQGLLIEANRIGKRDVRITGESLMAFMRSTDTASIRVRKL